MNEETLRELEEVRSVFANRKFRKAVRNEIMGLYFTYTRSGQGWEQIFKDFEVQCLRVKSGEIDFTTFKSKYPWSNSHGYVLRGQNNKIHLNSRHNLNGVETLEFVTHEIMHFGGYNHGTGICANRMSRWCGGREKLRSVPVKLAEIVGEIYLKGDY